MTDKTDAPAGASGGRGDGAAHPEQAAHPKHSNGEAAGEADLRADWETFRAFLALLEEAYAGRDGRIEIVCDDGAAAPAKAALKYAHLFPPTDIDGMVALAAKLNADGLNVYVSPGLRRPDLRGRAKKRDVTAVHFCWADFDKEGALDAALAEMERGGAPPNWITSTGVHPHKRGQVFWMHDGADPGAVEKLNGEIAQRFRGDAVKNCDRLMRGPGAIAWPRKPGRIPEHTARVRGPTRGGRYAFADLQRLLAPHPHGCWARAALERACARVASTPPGGGANGRGRNSTLNAEAFGLGQIVGADLLEADEVERHLRDAARACGLDDGEIDRVLPRAIHDGARAPRGPPEEAKADVVDEEGKRSIADAVVAAATPGIKRLFHDKSGRAWSLVVSGARVDTLRIGSRRFASWLRQRYHANTRKTVSGEALTQAVLHFETEALFGGDSDEPAIRVGEHNGAILLDLADERGRCVSVSALGWTILDEAPIPFYRPPGMRPLPLPEAGGDLMELGALLNLRTDESDEGGDSTTALILLISWLLGALRPRGPYPVLVVRGPPGSAKTSAVEISRSVIDPAAPATRNLPEGERDLFIATDATHIIAIDNVSHIKDCMSDAICRLSTCGGYATRTLYTDGEETIFEAERPVILNGIGTFITRGDLQDRALTLELEAIPRGRRRLKSEIEAAAAAARPRILGALLDAEGLRRLPHVQLDDPPRLADFAVWATACETAYAPEGTFTRAWRTNRERAFSDDLAADPFAIAVLELLAEAPPEVDGARLWSGTTGQLLAALRAQDMLRDLPRGPAAARSALDRSRPMLERAGVTITRRREGRRRTVNLSLAAEPSPSSPPPPPSGAKADPW